MNKEINKMSFEEALKALEEIVNKLERGEVGLDESITLYKEGIALQQHCEKQLKEAKTTFAEVVRNDKGSLTLVEKDLPEE